MNRKWKYFVLPVKKVSSCDVFSEKKCHYQRRGGAMLSRLRQVCHCQNEPRIVDGPNVDSREKQLLSFSRTDSGVRMSIRCRPPAVRSRGRIDRFGTNLPRGAFHSAITADQRGCRYVCGPTAWGVHSPCEEQFRRSALKDATARRTDLHVPMFLLQV